MTAHFRACCAALALTIIASTASASTILIGDKDGFGVGVPTNGLLPFNGATPQDDRSSAEKAATNGAQLTDTYTSLYGPPYGPSGTDSHGVITFQLPTPITSGTFSLDMGDFQASDFGQIDVAYNGVLQNNLFNFQDGLNVTETRSFALNAAELAKANAAGAFIVTLDRGSSRDFVDFDYFQLDYTATPSTVTPEPSSFALLGTGLLSVFQLSRYRRSV